MKLIVSVVAAVFVVGGVVAGCGSPAITCQTQACNNNTAKSFQACSHVDGTVSYNYGGMSCDCHSNDQAGCNACAMQVANYCTGGAGGAGGGGGGGAGGGGGGGGTSTQCTATFSGAFSATYSPCAFSVTVAGGTWTLGTAGNPIPNTPSYVWTGVNMNFNGTNPAAGTYDQTMSKGTGAQINAGQAGSWVAAYGSGMTVGSVSATITDLGPMTTVQGNPYYTQPHGSVTATLKFEPAGAMADENLAITF